MCLPKDGKICITNIGNIVKRLIFFHYLHVNKKNLQIKKWGIYVGMVIKSIGDKIGMLFDAYLRVNLCITPLLR